MAKRVRQMVKRRRLETPTSDELHRIEQQLRSDPTDRATLTRAIAPIAQVAAESASQAQTESVDARAARAKIEADAARFLAAREQGLLMVQLPVDQIDEHAIIRDRLALNDEDMQELRHSISANGLRLPIEVFELERHSKDGPRYGLLSGYRRLVATRELLELTEAKKYSTIRSIIRPREDSCGAFVSMIEENEVREELSHFERGRIAVIATNQGAFSTSEEAVERLFASGSKAKRSKIRSFALIFEELGDMLRFPEKLTERRGLQLASALRRGVEGAVRETLSQRQPEDADEEWLLIETVIQSLDACQRERNRGGRPKTKSVRYRWIDDKTLHTSTGVTIKRAVDNDGHILRLEGHQMSASLMDSLMVELQALLEK